MKNKKKVFSFDQHEILIHLKRSQIKSTKVKVQLKILKFIKLIVYISFCVGVNSYEQNKLPTNTNTLVPSKKSFTDCVRLAMCVQILKEFCSSFSLNVKEFSSFLYQQAHTDNQKVMRFNSMFSLTLLTQNNIEIFVSMFYDFFCVCDI